MFNGADIRGKNISKPNKFVYRQWGRIWELDENGKKIGKGFPLTDYGEMITFINKVLRKAVMKNLKKRGAWK